MGNRHNESVRYRLYDPRIFGVASPRRFATKTGGVGVYSRLSAPLRLAANGSNGSHFELLVLFLVVFSCVDLIKHLFSMLCESLTAMFKINSLQNLQAGKIIQAGSHLYMQFTR